MQIVSLGENLHNLHRPMPTFWENKKNLINLSSAEFIF